MRKKTPLDIKATFGICFPKKRSYIDEKTIQELYSKFMNHEQETK